MSSKPPTDVAASPTARWRSPAGWSLRTRLVVTMLALLAVTFVIVGVAMELTLRHALYGQLDKQLTAASIRSPQGLDERNRGPGRPRFGDPCTGPSGRHDFPRGQTIGTLIAVVCGDTVRPLILDDSGDPSPLVNPTYHPALRAVAAGTEHSTVDLGAELGDYRVLGRAGPGSAVIVTGVPLSDTQDTLYLVAGVVAAVTLVALGAVGVAGAVVVRRTLEPLSRVAATASRVSELKLDRGDVELAQRVPEQDTDPRTEVGQVGAALNRMLDHVGAALERRHASEMQVRQFVADASHELRTPLAAIRGYAELSRRTRTPVPDEVAHVLRRVESEATRMTALVEDLLLLARLDAGRPLGADPVDLTMLVVDAVGDAHATGPAHDWQLDLPDQPVLVTGDGPRLYQILANLLANARTHTPDGTSVTVRVATTTDQAVLRVVDTGPGIPAELLPHIFERFARGDSTRSRTAGSTGLGLSIVHAVVSAHRGTVSVASAPGHTEFTVRLPLGGDLSRRSGAVHQHPAHSKQ